jgi:CRISPR-associated exonuclease Cas4
MPPNVRISEIGLYLRCPRLVYFESLGRLPLENDPRQLFLRSMMLSISSKDDLEGHMREIASRLEEELPAIYDVNAEDVVSARQELEEAIEGMARGLAESLDLLLPCDSDVDLHSEKLGLSGRLDRLAAGGVPSIIRTGKAPTEGVWKRDRLMLAGYCLLLAEKKSERIRCGLVEYPRQGLVRPVEIHSVDRARVLRIRDRVRLIKDGQLPDRPENAPCEKCRAKETCETRHSLASRFF